MEKTMGLDYVEERVQRYDREIRDWPRDQIKPS